jgi:hypothetical protein
MAHVYYVLDNWRYRHTFIKHTVECFVTQEYILARSSVTLQYICSLLEFGLLFVHSGSVCLMLRNFSSCLTFVTTYHVDKYCDMQQ